MQDDKYGPVWNLLHATIKFDQHYMLKMLSFFNVYFWLLYKKIRRPKVCGFLSRASVKFHYFMCLFLCQYYVTFFTVSLFEVRDGHTSSSSFIVHNSLSYPGFAAFPYEAEN